ncbi:MAG: BON domain-containing protein [Opitutaceae bacterium]
MSKLPLLCLALGALSFVAVARADNGNDEAIRHTADNSYNFRVVLAGQVRAHVHDGVVTLTGKVRDEDQKSLAENTVNEIPGVRDIDDQIQVRGAPAPHSDDWMAFKIRMALLFHRDVSASHTKVSVTDGVATLTGVANSEAEKELEGQYAHEVDGVKSVVNDVQVVPESDKTVPSYTRPVAGPKEDDGSITAEIKYELLTHKATTVTTHVTTHDGVVTISGQASNDAEKELVTHLARDVRGVTRVNNEMTVKGEEPGS